MGSFIVGTSGYSFKDWVGTFYPPEMKASEWFGYYAARFRTLELNFTFYAMPVGPRLEGMARSAPPGFEFWIKANQELTHKANLSVSQEFLDNLYPFRDSGKLAGILLQFPQSFRRTPEARRYLDDALRRLAGDRLAVEFRHQSWDNARTVADLAGRNVSLVVPDAPAIPSLFRPRPTVAGDTGYLRLHSRDASKWYAGAQLRYDYNYSDKELREVIDSWRDQVAGASRVYAFFNNCHGGQAANNALRFEELVQHKV